MRLVQSGERVTMYMDDVAVLQDQELTDRYFRYDVPHHVAIGGEAWPDQDKPAIFRNIQIRKMN